MEGFVMSARDRQHLLLAAREPRAQVAQPLEQVGKKVEHPSGAPVLRAGADFEVLLDRKRGKDLALLARRLAPRKR
jgi:hypothetical protein